MISTEDLLKRFGRAAQARSTWEGHWRECYDNAMPWRQGFPPAAERTPGAKVSQTIFDGTAPDAADQLAASLLGQLTPPWAQWFGLTAGELVEHAAGDGDTGELSAEIEGVAAIVQGHFDRSNFQVEIHQAYMDLVVAGTASVQFEENDDGAASAFRFCAVPPYQLYLEENAAGLLDTTFRRYDWPLERIRERFPGVALPAEWTRDGGGPAERTFGVLEAVVPDGKGRYDYRALALGSNGPAATAPAAGEATELRSAGLAQPPFVNFRWSKAAGEVYGRSPVMKILPDIKTANKVVELVLKNASIAVTGMWQADDDGVINPAAIKLVPGTIIPKAVGSAGLQPLQAPGRFDVSSLVLDQLQARIRHALLVDRLAEIEANARMTATEVLERVAEMARLLGATYGRLQTELLNPLVGRAVHILGRRGDIPPIRIDGRLVKAQYLSPLAKAQALEEARNGRVWVDSVTALGPGYAAHVAKRRVVAGLGRMLGVPADWVATKEEMDEEEQNAAVDATAQAAVGAMINGAGQAGGGGQPR